METTALCVLSDENKDHIFNTGNGELILLRAIMVELYEGI